MDIKIVISIVMGRKLGHSRWAWTQSREREMGGKKRTRPYHHGIGDPACYSLDGATL